MFEGEPTSCVYELQSVQFLIQALSTIQSVLLQDLHQILSTINYPLSFLYVCIISMCVLLCQTFPPRILSNEPAPPPKWDWTFPDTHPLLQGSGVSDAQRQSWFDQMEREALRYPSAVVALSEVDRKTLKALATRDLDVEVGLGYMPRHGIPVSGVETLCWSGCDEYL